MGVERIHLVDKEMPHRPDTLPSMEEQESPPPPAVLGPDQVTALLGPTACALQKPRGSLSASQRGYGCQCCLHEYL